MDRDAILMNQASLRQSESNMTAFRRHMHDINYAYADQSLAVQRLRSENKISAQQARTQMLDARKVHLDAVRDTRTQMQAEEDLMNRRRDEIRQVYEANEARRHAGQAIMANGFMAVTAGASMIYMGAQGVRAWSDVTQAAIDYEQEARRTLTQVDKAGISLRQVSEAGKEIADEVPVAFEQIQPALYDVFSSIDVNMREARKLTKQFSKDAVAGTTDVAVATRANLQIMNAYGISVKDAADVSDFMFQLVRKGVGSYEEFASTIGRAIPSARRAGQSYQTLGAMMAFLTRNGLSAAMAATSSARALDAISHTKTDEKLRDMGIQTRNAKGEFLPLIKILEQMNDQFGDMTAPERSKALYELFKSSGGTIQARRFFDLYFKNSKEFEKRTREMSNVAGEAEKAFNTMAESPQARLQALKNDWMLLRIEIGENFMPIALKVMDTVSGWIAWFRQLDPETKKTITTVAALVTGLLILVGTITVVVGAMGIFVGGIKAMGWSVVGTTGKIAGLTAGMGFLVKGLYDAHKATTDSDKAISALESTAGGALSGFAVGGPIGALVGGFAGLMANVFVQSKNAKGGIEEAAAAAHKSVTDWTGLKDTLDQVTGATTKMTAQFIKDKIVRGPLRDLLAEYHIDLRTGIQAILGNEAAIARVNHAMEVESIRVKDARKAWKEKQQAYEDAVDALKGSRGTAVLTREQKEEAEATHKAYLELKNRRDAIKSSLGALRQNRKEVRENAATVGDYGMALKRLPKSVRQQIQLENVPKTRKELQELIDKYNIMDKKTISSLLELIGVKPTKEEIKAIQDKLKETNDQKTEPKIGANNTGALRKLGVVRQTINDIVNGTYVVTIHVKTQREGGGKGGKGGGGAASGSSQRSITGGGLPVGGKYGPIDPTLFKKAQEGIKRAGSAFGRSLVAEMLSGIKDEAPKLGDILDKVEDQIDKRFPKMKDKAKKALIHRVRGEIQGLANDLKAAQQQYEKSLKALRKAREELQALKDEKADFIANTSSELVSWASFANLEMPQPEDGRTFTLTPAWIAGQLQIKLNQIKQFGLALRELHRAGWSGAIIKMIISMGPEAGLQYATALLQASPGMLTEMNQSMADIQSWSDEIAQQAGSWLYDAGIATAQGIVDGLEKQTRDDLQKVKDLAIEIANTIDKTLKNKRKDVEESGKKVAEALAQGMLNNIQIVKDAAKALMNAATGKDTAMYGQASHGANASATAPWMMWYPPSGGIGNQAQVSTPTVHQEITVHTQEINPRKHAAQLGWELANRTTL